MNRLIVLLLSSVVIASEPSRIAINLNDQNCLFVTVSGNDMLLTSGLNSTNPFISWNERITLRFPLLHQTIGQFRGASWLRVEENFIGGPLWTLALGDIRRFHRNRTILVQKFHSQRNGYFQRAEMIIGANNQDFLQSCVPGTLLANIPTVSSHAVEKLVGNDGSVLFELNEIAREFVHSSKTPGIRKISQSTILAIHQRLLETGSVQITDDSTNYWNNRFSDCVISSLPDLVVEISGIAKIQLKAEDYMTMHRDGSCSLNNVVESSGPQTVVEIVNIPQTNVLLNNDGTYSLCQSRD